MHHSMPVFCFDAVLLHTRSNLGGVFIILNGFRALLNAHSTYKDYPLVSYELKKKATNAATVDPPHMVHKSHEDNILQVANFHVPL